MNEVAAIPVYCKHGIALIENAIFGQQKEARCARGFGCEVERNAMNEVHADVAQPPCTGVPLVKASLRRLPPAMLLCENDNVCMTMLQRADELAG